jgi:hypothetical protein
MFVLIKKLINEKALWIFFNKVYYAYFLAICLIIHFYYTVSLILNMFLLLIFGE